MEENTNYDSPAYSKAVRAGKRTYFFDVKKGKLNDFFIKLTESKRLPDSDKYIKRSIFIYKEDFEKFSDALNEALDYIKENEQSEDE